MTLLKANRITTTHADKATQQFRLMLSSQSICAKLKNFHPNNDRLDELYHELVGSHEQFSELWKCLQLLLLLSHGNATVESGFSVNEDMLVYNMKERSLIALRMVYDSIKAAGGCLSVNIDKEMITKCRGAYSAYSHYLEKQKKADKNKSQETEMRKRAIHELREEENKRKRLEDEIVQQNEKITAMRRNIK